jgi:hypothetical protein
MYDISDYRVVSGSIWGRFVQAAPLWPISALCASLMHTQLTSCTNIQALHSPSKAPQNYDKAAVSAQIGSDNEDFFLSLPT